jgi:hypothetical protein
MRFAAGWAFEMERHPSPGASTRTRETAILDNMLKSPGDVKHGLNITAGSCRQEFWVRMGCHIDPDSPDAGHFGHEKSA